MQTILLIPVLAAVCFGAAIPNPQEWESPTSISGRPVPTYTIVVPCFPGITDCVPKTLTYVGAEAVATAVAREAAPQELGSPSRTVLLPTPPPVPTTKKPSFSTKKPTSTSKKSSTSKKPSTSTKKTYYKRQELGSPTRTVLLPSDPAPPPPPTTTKKPLTSTKKPTSTSKKPSTSTKKPTSTSKKPATSTKKPTSTSKKPSTSTKKTYYKRQELGSPTRTVLLPTVPPPPPPPTTTKKPLTSTKKQTSTTKKPVPTTKKTHYRRQDLGSPTRTDLLATPVPITPKTTSTQKPPPHLPTYSGPWWGPGPTVTITVTYYPTFTTKAPTTSRYTTSETASTRTVSTTLQVPLDKRQELGSPTRTQLWPWPIPTHKTTTKYVTVTVTHKPPPPLSPTSNYYSFTSRQPSSTLAITLHERQELGEPSRTDLLPINTASSIVTSTIKSSPAAPTTILISTVKVPYPTTVSVIKTTTDVVTKTKTKTTCTEQPTTWDHFPTYPVTSRTTSYGQPTTSRTISTIMTVPYDKRQEIGGPIPSFTIPDSISIPDASPIPTRTYGKRQALGSPSRSFTYVVPTTTGRVVTLYRDI